MIVNASEDIYRSYLQFNLETLPVCAIIVYADLNMYHYYTFGTEDINIGLHQVTENCEKFQLSEAIKVILKGWKM